MKHNRCETQHNVKKYLKIDRGSISQFFQDFATLLKNLVPVCVAIVYGFVYTKSLGKVEY